jgi:bla regulator protein blaR1
MTTLYQTGTLLSHALAWALLYSLWQGLLVYGAVYLLLKALANMNARVKYYLSAAALLWMFVWFADTWAAQYEKLKAITVYMSSFGAGSAASAQDIIPVPAQGPAMQHLLPRLEQYYPFIIAVYVAGLLFMLLRFALNLAQVQRLRKKGLTYAGHQWNDFITQWRKNMGIAQPVKLFLSRYVNVPMVLGTLRPVILLPVATISHLSTEQVEAILLHELAHIRRKDYLLNIIQAIIETILFFNPFVWLVSGIIRREREHCCDDMVVTSTDPLPYAKALAILESTRTNNAGLTLAVTGHKNQLFHRIKRIMEMKKKNLNYSQLTIVIVALIAIMFIISMCTFTPSFAQKSRKDKAPKSDTTQKSVYIYKTVTIDSNGKKTVTEEHSTSPEKHKVSVEDGDNTSTGSKTKGYSYSFSYDDDDTKSLAKEIAMATKDAIDAVADIDLSGLKNELRKAQREMQRVDWDEIQEEIDNSISELNKELKDSKLRKDINAGVREALEKTKATLQKASERIKNMPPAPPPVPTPPPGAAAPPMPPMPPMQPHASRAGNSYETMLNKMEKDGLIDRSEKYKVEKDDYGLYINGEKQPESVYNKYSKYLKDRSVTIKGKKGTLSITVND